MQHIGEAMLDGVTKTKKYQVVNGTSYDIRTSKTVIDILEKARESRLRLLITYGDVETGEHWNEACPNRGIIGRSTGDSKVPLLIRTSRSLGGEAVLDHCIVKIQESKGGKVLWSLTA